jgi:hypothetical protein
LKLGYLLLKTIDLLLLAIVTLLDGNNPLEPELDTNTLNDQVSGNLNVSIELPSESSAFAMNPYAVITYPYHSGATCLMFPPNARPTSCAWGFAVDTMPTLTHPSNACANRLSINTKPATILAFAFANHPMPSLTDPNNA